MPGSIFPSEPTQGSCARSGCRCMRIRSRTPPRCHQAAAGEMERDLQAERQAEKGAAGGGGTQKEGTAAGAGAGSPGGPKELGVGRPRRGDNRSASARARLRVGTRPTGAVGPGGPCAPFAGAPGPVVRSGPRNPSPGPAAPCAGPGPPGAPGHESVRARVALTGAATASAMALRCPARARRKSSPPPRAAPRRPGRPVLSAGGACLALPLPPLLAGCPCAAPRRPQSRRLRQRPAGPHCILGAGAAARPTKAREASWRQRGRTAPPAAREANGRRGARLPAAPPRPAQPRPRGPTGGPSDPGRPRDPGRTAERGGSHCTGPAAQPENSVTERVPLMGPAWPRPRASTGFRAGRPPRPGRPSSPYPAPGTLLLPEVLGLKVWALLGGDRCSSCPSVFEME